MQRRLRHKDALPYMLKTWEDLRDTFFRKNISGIARRSSVRLERSLLEKRPLTRSRVLQKESIPRPWRYSGRISIDLAYSGGGGGNGDDDDDGGGGGGGGVPAGSPRPVYPLTTLQTSSSRYV
ncbi:Uncharacterized protein DBV15_01182 [Temnothorax longispinosus]|uniref:Uncharacterized protein n=1 Tax=Temnothorax longispinosus TaxID=300112 RepID=A0A4V3S635_9HYME|nr:Uncharacterized protein DBV15_01182 [Temnothorax longispinosus]